MELSDIENLANKYLKVLEDDYQSAYTFKRIYNDDIHYYNNVTFDFRLETEHFKSAHITLIVVGKEQQNIVGNASMFLIEKEQFKELPFWKVEVLAGKPTMKHISLCKLPYIEQASQIFMHGYIQGLSFAQKKMSRPYTRVVYRYIKLILCIANLCKEQNVPMLIETMGGLQLTNRVRSAEFGELTLSKEDYERIGITRNESIVSEKMARLLRLRELNGVFNQRTFGKVFFSVPA